MEHEDPNLLLKLLSSLGNFRQAPPSQPDATQVAMQSSVGFPEGPSIRSATQQDARPLGTGLLADLFSIFDPTMGALSGGLGAIPNNPSTLLALASILIPGPQPGEGKAIAGLAKKEGKAIRNLFEGPIQAAQEAGDVGRQTSLLREMIQARQSPRGFSGLLDDLTSNRMIRQATLIEEGEGISSAFFNIPGKIDDILGKVDEVGRLDIDIPRDAGMQNTFSRADIQQLGREIIETFESEGHTITSITGIRGGSGKVVEFPREFFFPSTGSP